MAKTLPLYVVALGSLLGGQIYGAGIYGAGSYGMGITIAQAGPQAAKEIWLPETILISTPSQAIPQFFLYRNTPMQANLIGASINGNADQVPFVGNPLSPGELLIGEWLGGDAGAQAIMTVAGTKRVP